MIEGKIKLLLRTHRPELDRVATTFGVKRNHLVAQVATVIAERYKFMTGNTYSLQLGTLKGITNHVVADLQALADDSNLSYAKNLLEGYLSDPI